MSFDCLPKTKSVTSGKVLEGAEIFVSPKLFYRNFGSGLFHSYLNEKYFSGGNSGDVSCVCCAE